MSLSRLNIMSRLRSEFSGKQAGLLAEILEEIQSDTTTVQASLTAVAAAVDVVGDGFNTAMTKLNADAGVTDTNYATVTIDAAADVTAISATGI